MSTATTEEMESSKYEMVWERCDATVSRWLATQLDHKPMAVALQGIRDLHFDPAKVVWRMPLEDEDSINKQSVEGLTASLGVASAAADAQSSSFIPRLDDIARAQIISHVRR